MTQNGTDHDDLETLIFDEKPDSEDVATALTIEDHRRENQGWEER